MISSGNPVSPIIATDSSTEAHSWLLRVSDCSAIDSRVTTIFLSVR